MKITLALFAVLCWQFSFSQTWLKMMNDPSANYYDVQRSFLIWRDSVHKVTSQKLHRDKDDSDMFEEEEERYYAWANLVQYEIDAAGNRLTDQERRQHYQDYRSMAGGNHILQSQGSWVPRGPFAITSAYGNVRGLGRMIGMCINPNDSLMIYAIDASGDLWKSIDEGNNWNVIYDASPVFSFHYIKSDPVNGNILYAVISGNLYKSVDAAVTWTPLNAGSIPSYFKLLIDPANTQHLLFGGTALHESTDGGATWNIINPSCNYADLKLKPGNSSVIYGIGSGNKIYRSTDGGLSFSLTATLSLAYGVQRLGVTAADSNYVYAYGGNSSGNGAQVAISADGGNTFTNCPVSASVFDAGITNFEVSPVNRNLLISVGTDGSRSADGGQTWQYASSWNCMTCALPYLHPDNRFVLFNGSSFWTCTDGGIYKSPDGGVNWLDRSVGLSTTQFYSIRTCESDTSVFLGGSIDNAESIHTAPGWKNIFSGDGANVAVKPSDPLNVYGKGQFYYFRSYDGGVTQFTSGFFQGLTESLYGFSPIYPIVFNHQRNASLFLLVNNVWKSTDDGTHVQAISSFSSNSGGGFLYVCNTDSNIIFTSFYHTVNGGATWIANTKKVLAVDPDEPGKVWARNFSYEPAGVFYSSDTGRTWITVPSYDITIDQTAAFSMRCANNTHNGVFLFSNANIFYRDDRLSNWQPFNNGLPYVQVNDMEVLPDYHKVRIATFGRGIWESGLYDSTQAVAADFLADKLSVCPYDTVHFYDNSLNNGPAFSPVYQWSFPGGTPSVSSLANPSVVYASTGFYSVTLIVTNSNGADTITRNMYINVNPPPVFTLPLTEGFESAQFPPAGWNVNHYATYPDWISSPVFQNMYGAYGHSAKSILYSAYQNAPPGHDYFTTPVVNLATISDPNLAFDFCYPEDTLNRDTMRIFYTTDCGATKNYFYTRGGESLKTAIQGISYFMPDSTTWKSDTIDVSSLASLGDIQFGFEMRSRNICNVFLDNVSIFSGPGLPTGASPLPGNSNQVSIYPNPACDQLNVVPVQSPFSIAYVEIYDATGKLCMRVTSAPNGNAVHLNIAALPRGLYFCKTGWTDGSICSRKFTISR